MDLFSACPWLCAFVLGSQPSTLVGPGAAAVIFVMVLDDAYRHAPVVLEGAGAGLALAVLLSGRWILFHRAPRQEVVETSESSGTQKS